MVEMMVSIGEFVLPMRLPVSLARTVGRLVGGPLLYCPAGGVDALGEGHDAPPVSSPF